MPIKVDEYLRKIGALNVFFAASSIGLLLVMGWMVYDDYHRGWKGYQAAFLRLEAEKTEAEIRAARDAIDQTALQSLQAELQEARSAAERHARDRAEAERRIRSLDAEHYSVDLQYRTIKSTYDAKKFDFEEARHAGARSAAELEREMDVDGEDLEGRRVRLLEIEKAQGEAEAALRAVIGRAEDAQKKIHELNAGVDRLRKRLETVAPRGLMRAAIAALNAPLMDFVAPTFKIQQVVLDRVPIDINFTRIPRADRCQTCHLAADRAGFEAAEQPFRSHPRPDLFVGGASAHPADRFGCTSCHAGRDRAVDFVYAVHNPDSPEQKEAWERTYGWERDHHWEHPMLPRSRTEAGCLKCHQGVAMVPEAPSLNRGIAIIDRYGCFGCHKMRGWQEREKVGPTLTRVASKTTPAWLARWIGNPKAFRPSSRMPRFFGLPNNREPGDAEREAAEIQGIVAYLTEKGEKVSYPPLPGRGEARRGERLVKTVGCTGCHAIEKDELPPDVIRARDRLEAADPVAWERRFGPDLSRVGSKLRPEWIFRWVQDPRSYDPNTRMPDLRLTTREALDVTAYLITLRDEGDSGASAAAPAPRPEARDRTLLAYLSQRMTPEDARARLAGMGAREKDVLLGERTIQRYGCFGCHIIPGFEKSPPIGTDLSEEGSKHPDLLFFGYVKIEHTAPAWFYQKLRSPRSFDEGKVATFYDRLRMPQFDFTDEQAALLTLVLQGLTKEKVPLESVRRLTPRDEAVEAGRRLMREHNCKGCHIVDGAGGAIRQSIARNLVAEGMSEDEAQATVAAFAPPILEGEGDKVQPDWLFDFLKAPAPIRPWLAVRMPTFGFSDAQTNALVHAFAARDNRSFPFQTLPLAAPRGEELRAALRMFTPDYFNCWSCHQQGARKPQGPPEGWAPDLTLAHRRLNPDWIARWIENPQALMPGTKMPTYYDPEDPRGSAPPDILGGDPQRQMQVLRDYVFTLGARGAGRAGAQP
ncbi:MAG: c-type cytochrome [Acidobacteria bacterium]|nr:c-type cytochrome [Acidobacteriota bacterium]